ncbi:hemerythrin domain-containing protein [Paenibacillus soyae]|uniref:Hemerythrin domain-containing protein n=1 Tax=Paenibacillus soyae TaxID=2969249 RepID=A0A9X2MNR9_9BACL|nr:hemerythrin domain-containing protein [Paenibacillus soyae]MCR2804071.1 hemerythrin domain-containing protein [Paenibacillus soyae]
MDSLALKPPLQQLFDEHIPLRAQMERIFDLACGLKEAGIGGGDTQLRLLVRQMTDFAWKLEQHSDREENLLFPMMARYLGRETGPIAVMEYEHDQAKRNIELFHEAYSMHGLRKDGIGIGQIAGYAEEAVTILMEHFCKEEHALFPMANNLLSEQELEQLEQAFTTGQDQGGDRI